MITVELVGRTGNNMFQIATAMSIAKKNKTLAKYWGKDSHVKGFKLKGIEKATKPNNKKYIEKTFNYDKEIENVEDGTNIEGYFQSEKYFSNIKEEVKRCFSFTSQIVNNVETYCGGKFKDILKGENATALHVRRTDYLKHPEIYTELDKNYYMKCLENIQEKGRILVFSDDFKWCEKQFDGDFNFIKIGHIESMYLMSKCKNVIIANSTFSWWSAWIGNPKKVIYPKNWFGKEWPYKNVHTTYEECTKDLFPQDWHGM